MPLGLDFGHKTIGRMEDGQPTKVSDLYVNALCDAYKATAGDRKTLLGLALEVRTAQKSGGWMVARVRR